MKRKDITEDSNNQWFSCGLREDQELSTEDSRRQVGLGKKAFQAEGTASAEALVEKKEALLVIRRSEAGVKAGMQSAWASWLGQGLLLRATEHG